MSFGGQGDTRTTPRTSWWTLLPESWRSYLRGLECIGCSGIVFPTAFLQLPTYIILRDIPLPLVTSGCENSGNLRELALQRMKDFGAECRDVRFREVGVSIYLPSIPIDQNPYISLHPIDPRNPPQSPPRISRTPPPRLYGQRRLGDLPILRRPRARHTGWLAPSTQMLRGGDIPS